MSATSIKCSGCSEDVVASEQPFVCVEVKDRYWATVAMEAMNENTAAITCLVHEECMEQFVDLVASGKYAGLNSN